MAVMVERHGDVELRMRQRECDCHGRPRQRGGALGVYVLTFQAHCDDVILEETVTIPADANPAAVPAMLEDVKGRLLARMGAARALRCMLGGQDDDET